jgi:hypothetical protein
LFWQFGIFFVSLHFVYINNVNKRIC